MSIREVLIFVFVQFIMVAWSHWESYLEGDSGWTWNDSWWRFKLFGPYVYTAYHVWAFWIFAPMALIVLPLLVAGFSWRLFWLLLSAYLIGSMVEDFMWFVVNPRYPLSRWNPRDTKWYPWITFGKFYLPASYVLKTAIALIILFGPFRFSI